MLSKREQQLAILKEAESGVFGKLLGGDLQPCFQHLLLTLADVHMTFWTKTTSLISFHFKIPVICYRNYVM